VDSNTKIHSLRIVDKIEKAKGKSSSYRLKFNTGRLKMELLITWGIPYTKLSPSEEPHLKGDAILLLMKVA
jgi:hypothetical protein